MNTVNHWEWFKFMSIFPLKILTKFILDTNGINLSKIK